MVGPSFSPLEFFCLVEILLNDSGVKFYGISGRLQFMSRRDASLVDESIGRDDVSLAWSVCLGLLSLHSRMRFSSVVVLRSLIWTPQ